MALDEGLSQVTPDLIEGLRRSEHLGSENDFTTAVNSYLFVREVAAAAAATDARFLKPGTHQNLESFLTEIRDTAAPQIQGFRWVDDGAAGVHQAITTRANEMADWARSEVVPWVQHGEVDSAKAEADAERLAELRQEAETVLSTLRGAAGEGVSIGLSGFFAGAANRYRTQSYWLAGGIVIALGALAILGWLFFFGRWEIDDTGASSDEWQELIEELTIRLFFLGLAAWALAFLARTYRVTRHLETVNAQKQAALDTYPLFLSAASSDQQRDIITAELARAVLQDADSGFITADRERTVIETSPTGLLRGGSQQPS